MLFETALESSESQEENRIKKSWTFLISASVMVKAEVCFAVIDRFRYSFICQGTSTRRQQSDIFGLRVKLPPVATTSLTTQK